MFQSFVLCPDSEVLLKLRWLLKYSIHQYIYMYDDVCPLFEMIIIFTFRSLYSNIKFSEMHQLPDDSVPMELFCRDHSEIKNIKIMERNNIEGYSNIVNTNNVVRNIIRPKGENTHTAVCLVNDPYCSSLVVQEERKFLDESKCGRNVHKDLRLNRKNIQVLGQTFQMWRQRSDFAKLRFSIQNGDFTNSANIPANFDAERQYLAITFLELIEQISKDSPNQEANLRKIAATYDKFAEHVWSKHLQYPCNYTLLQTVVFHRFMNVVENHSTVVRGQVTEMLMNKAISELFGQKLKEIALYNNVARNLATNGRLKVLSMLDQLRQDHATLSDLHELYQAQLPRLRLELQTTVDECTLHKQIAFDLARMICSKNPILVTNQLYSSNENWTLTGDQCILWIRKLLTELFETFAACIEGSLNLTAYLEYLITDSKGQLDNLCEQVNAVGHYLLPIFTEDFEKRNCSYLAKMIGQLDRLRTTTEQTNESLRTVWTVERIALIAAIGLSANHLETIEQENDIFRPDLVTNTESPGSRRMRGGALSSTLRLECSTRNVAQPLFYQQLLSNPNEHVCLFDIKLLLKSASDEFIQLSKVFCDVFLNQNNFTEGTSLFPKISDICQELSTLLTEQEACLLHLFELCDTGLPTLLCIVKQFVSECLQPVDSGEQTPRGLDWFKSKLDTWQKILPLNRFQGSVVPGSNSDVAETSRRPHDLVLLMPENNLGIPSGELNDLVDRMLFDDDHLESQLGSVLFDGQPPHPIASVESLSFRRLNELNEHFEEIVYDLERDRLHCQQTCVEWVASALRVFTVKPFWVRQLIEAERDEVAQNETTQLVEVDEQVVMESGQVVLKDCLISTEAPNVKVLIEVDKQPQPDRSDSLDEVRPQSSIADNAEKAAKDPAVTNQLVEYYEHLYLCELDYERMIGDFAMQMKSIRLIYSTILTKLTRLFTLSQSSKSPNVIEEVERILQAFKSATEKCTNDWESLYTELLNVTCTQSDDVITEQNSHSTTWWSEPAESLDVDEVRAQNQQNYICVNSIDYIREQKEAINKRLVHAHKRHQECVDALEKQQEVNKQLQAQFEQYELEFRETMAASLADLDHEVGGGSVKLT
ncbi:hypothetical protein EG68_08542 [Paragonimus skrjabini miyazakii]|uniref:Uncharacterized protein n=1 Tax=Paragonimus skrjabini miyazakii TaxID=59628 RepID=A0A8S9YNK5_9TREM|nr:hypothetical protein EG68_08542 [Paragonimus skrjabini miyazakii]